MIQQNEAEESATPVTEPSVRARLKGIEWAFLCLFIGLVSLISFRPIYAVDLFWHLTIGRVIAETMSIPTLDLFSAVHPESPWVQFQWLWDWIAYLISEYGGLFSLRLISAAVMATSFLVAYRFWRRRTDAFASFFLLSVLLILFGDRFRVRPDMMNLFFFVISMPLLINPHACFHKNGRILIFILGCLWSNFHGGGSLLYIVCFGALATGASIEWAIAHRRVSVQIITDIKVREFWFLVLCATGGVLANPALIPGVLHFLEIFGAATELIPNEEWFRTYTMWEKGVDEGFHAHFALVAALPYAIAPIYFISWANRRRTQQSDASLGELILCSGLLFLSHHWVRTAYLAVYPLGIVLQAFFRRQRGPVSHVVTALATIILVFTSYHYQIDRGRGGLAKTVEMASYDLEPTVYPVQAAQFIHDAGLQGKIFNEGKWGGYLIWKTWPECTVFFDTRHNLDEEMWTYFTQSLNPPARPGLMNAAFRRYDTELMVFKGPVYPLYEPPEEWALLYRAGRQEVYQHVNGPNAARNLEKSKAYYEKHGHDTTGIDSAPGLARLATAVGAEQWLKDPWRVMRIQENHARIAQEDSETKQKGVWLRARRRFQAAAYGAASEDLYLLLTEEPTNARALYLLAVSRYLMGDKDSAKGVLERLLGEPNSAMALKPMERWWALELNKRLGVVQRGLPK